MPRLPSIKLIVPLNFAQKLCKWLIRLDEIIMKNVPQGQIFWKLKQSRLELEIVVIYFVSRTVLLNFMETNEFICFIEAMKQILELCGMIFQSKCSILHLSHEWFQLCRQTKMWKMKTLRNKIKQNYLIWCKISDKSSYLLSSAESAQCLAGNKVLLSFLWIIAFINS